jgi:prepilin-type N-terminal cleavage/methylation domain-containing protein
MEITRMALGISKRSRRHEARRGLTLIEIVFALTLLSVALVGYARTIAGASVSSSTSREATRAANAAKRVIGELRSQAFNQVFRLYNSTTADDPFGVVAPGGNFAVAGLDARKGDADGMPGEILFPTQIVGGVLQLREDLPQLKLGMPSDLNGGGIDALDHSGNYKKLPVLVRVRWQGVSGPGLVEFTTVLGDF